MMNRKNNTRRSRRRRSIFDRAVARLFEPLEGRLLMSGDVVATVIQDTNKNGIADAGEPGLAGWTVFVDIDGSATLNAGDLSAVTNGSGVATISGVPGRTFSVYEVLPLGYAPAAGFKDFSSAGLT